MAENDGNFLTDSLAIDGWAGLNGTFKARDFIRGAIEAQFTCTRYMRRKRMQNSIDKSMEILTRDRRPTDIGSSSD